MKSNLNRGFWQAVSLTYIFSIRGLLLALLTLVVSEKKLSMNQRNITCLIDMATRESMRSKHAFHSDRNMNHQMKDSAKLKVVSKAKLLNNG